MERSAERAVVEEVGRTFRSLERILGLRKGCHGGERRGATGSNQAQGDCDNGVEQAEGDWERRRGASQ
jgi:hypothetical protein